MGWADNVLQGARGVLDAAADSFRRDDWMSTLSGLGDTSRDRATSVSWKFRAEIQPRELEQLYRFHAIARKVIDLPIDDAVEPGYELVAVDEEEQEQVDELRSRAASLEVDTGGLVPTTGALTACALAQKAADLYGLALLVGVFDDAAPPEVPLTPGARLRSLAIVDRWSVRPIRESGSANGRVIAWSLHAGHRRQMSMDVHPSRVLVFGGASLTPSLYAHNAGYPDSRLQRVYDDIKRDGVAAQVTEHLSSEAVVGKYKIPNLSQLIASEGASWVRSYMRTQHAMRSAMNAVLLDSQDGGYESDSVDFSGLVDVLNAWPERVAAAAEIPMMLLYGKSAPGMNATGEMDLRGYFKRVDARHRGAAGKLSVALRGLLEWLRAESQVEAEYDIRWHPLMGSTALEQAQERQAQAQADVAYITAGVLDPDEVAKSRFGGREYSAETVLDDELRADFADLEAAAPRLDAYDVPESARSNAQRGLDLREKFDRGGTDAGVATARAIKSGSISPEKAQEIRAWFARFEPQVDERDEQWANSDNPSALWIAWLLWGGDTMRNYVNDLSLED